MDPSYLGQPVPVPTANKPRGLMTGRTLLLVVGGALAVLAGGVMLFASGDNSGELRQRTSARQTTTLKLIADGQKNISDDDLAKINSEMSLVLLGDTTKLTRALKTAGLTKQSKTITAAEADADTFDKLKTAKLNAQYDAAYQTVITQKIESLRALLQELHSKTKSKTLKTVVADEYQHLGIYLNQLQKLE